MPIIDLPKVRDILSKGGILQAIKEEEEKQRTIEEEISLAKGIIDQNEGYASIKNYRNKLLDLENSYKQHNIDWNLSFKNTLEFF